MKGDRIIKACASVICDARHPQVNGDPLARNPEVAALALRCLIRRLGYGDSLTSPSGRDRLERMVKALRYKRLGKGAK